MENEGRASTIRVILWYLIWFIVLAAVIWLIVWAIFFRGSSNTGQVATPKGQQSQTKKAPSGSTKNKATTPPPSANSNSGTSQNGTSSTNGSEGSAAQAPNELVNTGPADTIAVFVIATAAGTIAYRTYLRRTLSD